MAVYEQAIMPVVKKKSETQGVYDTYGLNFSQADSSQERALREIEDLYKSGGDWVSAADALGTNGNFVSVGNEGAAPTGAYRSISGATNGAMLWGLNGQMASGDVPVGTQLIAPDGTKWQVGAGGALNPYQAAIQAADAGAAGTVPAGGSSYSASGGSASGSSVTPASNPYTAAISAFDYGPAPEWGGTEYERRRDAALQRAEDMKFSYDPNTDPSWLAYQKQYRREGQRATADALGQAAAMTGGSPSSYAVTAASQAGDYYAAQLSDRLPQLYQDAYNRYLQEYQRQLGIADAYAGYGQTEYNRYLDRLGQYNTDRNFAYGAYRDQVGDQQWADKFAYQKERDAVGDEQWQTQWAQELREYDDKLAQQARENGWTEQQYADARHDAAVDEALAIAKYLGYVPEQYAGILGVPAGTQYYTLANKTTGGSGGGGGTGAGTGDEGDLDGTGDRGNKGGNVNKFPELAAYVLEAAKLGTAGGELQRMMDTYYKNGWITAAEYDRLVDQYNESFGEPEIGNRHTDTWIDMGNGQRISIMNDLPGLIESGEVKETLRDGKYYYTWA